MDPCPTKPEVLASYVNDLWEDHVIDALSSYVAIPCLSPDFDPSWADNGEIGRAVRLLSEWAASRSIPGCAGRMPACASLVRHKRVVKYALPIWLYVSVTGVLVYLMLYQLPTN